MDAVLQKTNELGQALLESEAYKKMKAAEDAAMHNADAAAMMTEMLEKRTEMQQLMQSGSPDPAALKRLSDEIDTLQEKLQMMDDIVTLTKARAEFNGLIAQINQLLQFIVTGRMDTGDCSGDCGSCSGCH